MVNRTLHRSAEHRSHHYSLNYSKEHKWNNLSLNYYKGAQDWVFTFVLLEHVFNNQSIVLSSSYENLTCCFLQVLLFYSEHDYYLKMSNNKLNWSDIFSSANTTDEPRKGVEQTNARWPWWLSTVWIQTNWPDMTSDPTMTWLKPTLLP